MAEVTLKSVKEDFERFFRSALWEDLQLILLEGLEQGRDNLENLAYNVPDVHALGVCAGRLKQVRDIIEWPTSIPAYVEQIEAARQLLQKEEEGDEDAGDS